MNTNFEDIHKEIVILISKLKGIEDVKELFQNPNAYGDITGKVSFKFNVIDKYNYCKGEVSVDYKQQTSMVFIPLVGVFCLDKINAINVVKILKKCYKLK